MGGFRTMLSEQVESLLPRATAVAACLASSPWSSWHSVPETGAECVCSETRRCHTSCHGKTVCTPWAVHCLCF